MPNNQSEFDQTIYTGRELYSSTFLFKNQKAKPYDYNAIGENPKPQIKNSIYCQ